MKNDAGICKDLRRKGTGCGEKGAREFVSDLRKLPKPRSKISKAGYTHIVDTFSMKREKSGIEVGWGKYYGPMLEHGTRKMAAREHLKPLLKETKKNITEK